MADREIDKLNAELEDAHKNAASLAEDRKLLLAVVEDLRLAFSADNERLDFSDIEAASQLADDAIEDMKKRGTY